jgi:hypothetical protein
MEVELSRPQHAVYYAVGPGHLQADEGQAGRSCSARCDGAERETDRVQRGAPAVAASAVRHHASQVRSAANDVRRV